jgi:hypothetical protein
MAIHNEAYNNFEGYPLFPYNCLRYLLAHNEMIFKLLHYTTPDAWNLANLSLAQKTALIYQGQPDETQYRLFLDGGRAPDAWTNEACILRISNWDMYADNHVYGTVGILFEIFSHYKINTLNNYMTRIDMITQQILATMNGTLIEGGLGRLYFNRLTPPVVTKATTVGQTPWNGKWLILATKA